MKKNPAIAIGLWQRVIEKDKNFLPAHRRLAETWQKLTEYEKSAAEFEQVLRLQPEDSDAKRGLHEVLGDASAKQKRYAEACGEYAIAMKASPQNRRELEKKQKLVCNR
jgi:tetratricopeptide (TPR) repeat protein